MLHLSQGTQDSCSGVIPGLIHRYMKCRCRAQPLHPPAETNAIADVDAPLCCVARGTSLREFMSSPFQDESDLEVALLDPDRSTAPVTASAPPAGAAGGGQENTCAACHERTRQKGACGAASTGRCSRKCQLAACVTALILAVCTTIAILYYPRTPHLTFEGRSALHLDWPYFKNGLVLINFKMILAINNPNRYDVYFSNTEIQAWAYNDYNLGTVSEPKTLVLRHGEMTELTFDTHGAASIREGLELVVDCISNNLFTNVTARGFIDVHIGPALRLRHSVPPLKVHFPCVLRGHSGQRDPHEL